MMMILAASIKTRLKIIYIAKKMDKTLVSCAVYSLGESSHIYINIFFSFFSFYNNVSIVLLYNDQFSMIFLFSDFLIFELANIFIFIFLFFFF